MAKKPRIGLYRESTAKSVLEKLGKTERKNTNLSSKIGLDGNNPSGPDFIIAKITAEVTEGDPAAPTGYYTMQEQILDDTAVNKVDHAWANSADTVTFEAREITGLTGLAVGEVFRCWYEVTQNESSWVFQVGGGGLDFITSDNTGLSFNDGALYDRPEGTGTALSSSNEYYITTPWNTRVVAPNNFFGFCTKIGDDFYYQITKFYVRCDVNYSGTVNEGVDQFTCFLSRSTSSTNLGAQTGVSSPFPTGCEAFLDGFDNVNATTNSKNYFNGKVFPATYDSGSNKIYLEHPQF